ncbi:MAG TPA: carboxypeptidase-like regulatory domain-containing protein [Mucilaginibacter sp.]|jgi:hypothetical protein|nr:carboxypeptidase-like regulatory domain-containing protein [Mucilaginibacter sp.]
MKKQFFLTAILMIAMIQLSIAQIINATGTVKNDQGKPLASALVQENGSTAAIYTDSLGFFSLAVKNNATLVVSCNGYKEDVVPAKNNLVVVLKPGKSALKRMNAPLDPNVARNIPAPITNVETGFTTTNIATSTAGSLIPSFSHKEETVGSRYLLDNWSNGYVVNTNGAVIKNDMYAYNYDKLNGFLLLTQDRRAAVEVDKDQVKSFTIYNKLDVPLTYEMVPAIDTKHFTQVLSSGDKYRIYKYTQTTFVKSDFKTDGMTSSGNRYDEYVDESSYYVLNVKTSQLQKIALKSKAIKQAFADNADKVKIFYAQHSDDAIDEVFLKNLGDYLN